MLNAMDSPGTKETTWQRKPLSAQPSLWKIKLLPPSPVSLGLCLITSFSVHIILDINAFTV